MPRSFSVTGSLALPDHIVWALCAVPPWGRHGSKQCQMTLPRYWRQGRILLFQAMMTDAWKSTCHVREI